MDIILPRETRDPRGASMATTGFGCAIGPRLHEGLTCAVHRGRRLRDDQPVILKVARAASDRAALVHEHGVLTWLAAVPGVVPVLDLVEDRGRTALLLPDRDASSLRVLGVAGRLPVQTVLRLALALCETLDGIHRLRVLHKDLNPANLVILPAALESPDSLDGALGRPLVIDFGIATRLPQESVTFVDPCGLEGTLAYMAPEQTGRMNRAIDYRSDYYALGVTLFELLCGQRPFPSEDPLELLHCHIARLPPSLVERGVPRAVAAVVAKLLAKSADERYQSARGLRSDLLRCLAELRAPVDGGASVSFALGQEDLPERFRLPQRLYGREDAAARLSAALEQARHAATLLTVSGPAGIGKTALVQEIFGPLTAQHGVFIKGKFDQERLAPYSALLQALRGLAELLLSGAEERLQSWRERLGAALGGGAQVLIDVCPQLGLVLGAQPDAPVLPPTETQARFARLAGALLAACASPDAPLCLFLDDLQWADPDSLRLLEDLLQSAPGLLVVGAYRDNEVDAAHPLQATLRRLSELGVPLRPLAVAPLSVDDIGALLRDTLGAPAAQASALGELAALVHARTAGNPFFVRAFLSALNEAGVFVRDAAGWRWELSQAQRLGVTDNVVDLLDARLRLLPVPALQALQRAACLGGDFAVALLAQVSDRGLGDDRGAAAVLAADLARQLWAPVEAGLLLPSEGIHSEDELVAMAASARLRFAHDRIQEAALASVPREERAILHRDLGRRLLALTSDPVEGERWLFTAVHHCNLGAAEDDAGEQGQVPPALIDRESGRGAAALDLAELNLRAARTALRSAPRLALRHAQAGLLALRRQAAWRDKLTASGAAPGGGSAGGDDSSAAAAQQLTGWGLHLIGAEAASACGEVDLLVALCTAAQRYVRRPLDVARLGLIEARHHATQGHHAQAQEAYLVELERLGVVLARAPALADIGAEIGATAALLGADPSATLAALPPCQDEEELLRMEALRSLILATMTLQSPVFPLAVCCLVQRSVRHGASSLSALGVVFYGLLLARGGTPESAAVATTIGRAALALAERGGDLAVRSQVTLYAYLYLLHSNMALQELPAGFDHAYRLGLESGDVSRLSDAAMTLCLSRLLAGEELGRLTAEMARHADQLKRLQQGSTLTYLQIYQQAVANLREGGEEASELAGPHFDEAARLPALQAGKDFGALFNLAYAKVLLACLFGDARLAQEAAQAGAPYGAVAAGSSSGAPFEFFCALAGLQGAQHEEGEARAALVQAGREAEERLAMISTLAGARHRPLLLQAERRALSGDDDAAARAAFEQAVDAARDGAPLHELALCCERSGRFLLRCGRPRQAQPYLREAHAVYLRWGALALARALEQRHPALLPRVALSTLGTSMVSATQTGERALGALELISLLDASQALSREIHLDRLLAQLMGLLLSTSGAERGFLLLEQGGRLLVQAEGGIALHEPLVLQALPLERAAEERGLAQAVVHFAARSRETVLLDDVSRSPRYAADPHVAARRVRSLLCIPLLRQAGVLGVLYLENNLLAGAFTPAQVRILELLSTQAAIALENALLYETLEQKVAARTKELASRNQELSATLTQLREAQDRLLYQDRLATLGNLAAGVAHELRNPLNFVTNFAELSVGILPEIDAEMAALGVSLREDRAAPLREQLQDLRENLGRIKDHGRRMDGVVKSMLEHARGGRGDVQRVEVNALVKESVGLAEYSQRARTPGADFTVELKLDPEAGQLAVVPQDLSRVLLNLVDNACHALAQRRARLDREGHSGPAVVDQRFSPRILVSTRGLPGQVEIRVHDNGIGIAADVLSRIFEPFFTTKRAGEGTGLGLSIGRDIVERGCGGKLTVQSVAGDHAEFCIAIPRRT